MPRRPAGDGYWLYGVHAVAAALANPRRRLRQLLHVGDAGPAVRKVVAAALERGAAACPGGVEPTIRAVERTELGRFLPAGAVHQGIAADVAPLPMIDLAEICDDLATLPAACVLVLDQITDPHNVGAILRSAAALGATAVIVTERHAAPESGALAKAASGALDQVPLVRVGNLARALDSLKNAGFWCVGLAGEASQSIATADLGGKLALVLGAEGEGLRRLTRECCDLLVRLPTRGPIDQLNVSNAAAVALYEVARRRELPPSAPAR